MCFFFGSSGGGYAAIYAASLFPESVAIACNPQIYIYNYFYAEIFERITGINLKEKDKFYRNDIPHMIKHGNSKYCIISNVQSEIDISDQLLPFCIDLGISTDILTYGIAKHDNILLWLYDAKGTPDAHSSVETKSIWMAIEYIVNRFKDGDLTVDCNKLALLINEYWRDIYEGKYKEMNFEKEHINKKMFAIYLRSAPWKLCEDDIVDVLYNVMLNPSKGKYNCYRYDKFFANMFYTIEVDLEVEYPNCSVGLVNHKTGESIHAAFFSTDKRIQYSFITGDNIEGLQFVIHAGIFGQSQGKILLIRNFTVKARPLSGINEKDF